jgi:hypothetical protein
MLRPVEGLEEQQNSLLESAVCQGLVEGNGGGVQCPEAVHQALEVARFRAQVTGDTQGLDQMAHVTDSSNLVVMPKVDRAEGAWSLELSLTGPSKENAELGRVRVSAPSFEELVSRAGPAAKSLLAPE